MIKGPNCSKSNLIKGTLIGGLIAFAWGAISWMALPWHDNVLFQFKDERVVSQALKKNVIMDEPGIYVIPYVDESYDTDKKETNAQLKKDEPKPFAFMAVTPRGLSFSPGQMFRSLITQLLAAFYIMCLLLCTTKLSYWHRVKFVAEVALVGAILCYIPFMNWWGFSYGFTLINLLDLLIAWTIAGIVINKTIDYK